MIRIMGSVIGVLLIGIILLGVLYKGSLTRAGQLESDLEMSNMTVTALEVSIENLEQERQRQAIKTSKFVSELSQYERELAQYRNREDIVVAKPGLVTIKINKAYKALEMEVACETGDTTACVN